LGGIAGILVGDGDRPVDAEEIASMALGIAPNREFTGPLFREGRFGLVAFPSPGSRAGIAARSISGATVVAGFHGVLYDNPNAEAGVSDDPALPLLDLYVARGIESMERLRGDFVAVVWDERDRVLHLIVDPFRTQPLFYSPSREGILFASRMRAITSSPRFETRTLDPRAVIELVESSRISTPRTVYHGIAKVPEGHRILSHEGRVSCVRYWHPDYRSPDARSFDMQAGELHRTFDDSVRARLDRDTPRGPVGAYLSGGIDSTTIVGVMTRLMGSPVDAFSIGFEEAGFNELEFARHAARAFGARHHVHLVTAAEASSAIPLLLEAFDEPFGNASAVPAYYCALMASRQGMHTLYAGDGGDELFAGNEHYASRRLLEYYDRVPAPVRLLLEPAASAAGTLLPWGPFRKAHRYVQRARIPYPARLATYSLYNEMPRPSLFEQHFLELAGTGYDPFEAQAKRYWEAPALSELDRQLYVDLRLLITDSDLLKVTRTAEAAGVGVRFPFLDRRLADFAAAVPSRLKMRGRELRSFFKRAYSDLLPPETLSKKKHGFGLPIAGWLRTDPTLNSMMRDLVLSDRTLSRGIIRRNGAEDLVRRHAEDTTSFYGTAIWNLMILELWLRRHEERYRCDPVFGRVPC
jgi:asparagine synthase (glutamine-hydrolysing)